jgi:hypothetical protein
MTDTMPDEPSIEAIGELVMSAAAAAAARDAAKTKAALLGIVNQGDDALYGAAVGWAALALQLIGDQAFDGDLEILDPQGRPIDLDNPPDNDARYMIWALRFVQGYSARNQDACLKLFYGELYSTEPDDAPEDEPGHFLGGLLALLHLTATGIQVRDRQERHDGLRLNAAAN